MPALANITVKKNDNTTDIIYTGVVPCAGDKSPAIFRSNSVGSAAAFRPELRVQSSYNGPKTARRVTGQFTYPSTTVGSDGKINVADRLIGDFSLVVPQGMLDADVNEAVAQFTNLLDSTLLNDTFKSGYAPT